MGDQANNPCLRWKTHEICKKGRVQLKSICEEELSKNNWTVAADQAAVYKRLVNQKIYSHHSYPNSYIQQQDSEWGTIKTYDITGCKPKSVFPKGNIQSFCGNPDFEYYWETTPWSTAVSHNISKQGPFHALELIKI